MLEPTASGLLPATETGPSKVLLPVTVTSRPAGLLMPPLPLMVLARTEALLRFKLSVPLVTMLPATEPLAVLLPRWSVEPLLMVVSPA